MYLKIVQNAMASILAYVKKSVFLAILLRILKINLLIFAKDVLGSMECKVTDIVYFVKEMPK